MKKKIISIFLLLIIIVSQIGPAVIATEDTSITLEQYLIKNGVDTDGDKKISDAEWTKVKNLYLCSDIQDIKNVKEIEKAINLKSLDINGIDGFNTIDFSKLQKLESLSISYSDEVKNLDFSKVSNTKNLKSLYIDYSGDKSTLDFSKLTNLQEENIPIPDDITIYKNGEIFELRTDGKIEYENNIIEVSELYTDHYNILGKNVGIQNITIVDSNNQKKNIKVEVLENPNISNKPADTKLESTEITAKIVDYYKTILKSNGELWEVTSPTTARKIDTNVKDLKLWFTYSVGDGGTPSIKYSKLDKDNTLTIKVTDTDEYTDKEVALRTIKDVKEIGSNMYLNTKGELFTIFYNHITEEICTEKVRDHVKKILDYCIVLEDGTTWIQTDTRNTGEGAHGTGYVDYYKSSDLYHKIADFEVKAVGEYKVEEKNYYCAVDMNNNLYGIEVGGFWEEGTFNNLVEKKEKIEMKLLKENFNNFYTMDVPYFSTQKLYESDINNPNLSDVVQRCMYFDYGATGPRSADILVRTDGTIWTYSDEYGLTKITTSTQKKANYEKENKDFLNPTAKIHEKELGNTSILYGISDSTKVEDFKKQNNFNSTYEVKIYDKNDKELQDNNIIGTGSKVKLYKQGKIVKEYTVILYGDTTGDGKITSVDALAIIKHINNKIPFTKEEYIEAGKVRKESGKNLTSVDALATVKSVNGKFKIEKNN